MDTQAAGKFDALTYTELDMLWTALYDREQNTEYGRVKESCRALIDQLYDARNWPGNAGHLL